MGGNSSVFCPPPSRACSGTSLSKSRPALPNPPELGAPAWPPPPPGEQVTRRTSLKRNRDSSEVSMRETLKRCGKSYARATAAKERGGRLAWRSTDVKVTPGRPTETRRYLYTVWYSGCDCRRWVPRGLRKAVWALFAEKLRKGFLRPSQRTGPAGTVSPGEGEPSR